MRKTNLTHCPNWPELPIIETTDGMMEKGLTLLNRLSLSVEKTDKFAVKNGKTNAKTNAVSFEKHLQKALLFPQKENAEETNEGETISKIESISKIDSTSRKDTASRKETASIKDPLGGVRAIKGKIAEALGMEKSVKENEEPIFVRVIQLPKGSVQLDEEGKIKVSFDQLPDSIKEQLKSLDITEENLHPIEDHTAAPAQKIEKGLISASTETLRSLKEPSESQQALVLEKVGGEKTHKKDDSTVGVNTKQAKKEKEEITAAPSSNGEIRENTDSDNPSIPLSQDHVPQYLPIENKKTALENKILDFRKNESGETPLTENSGKDEVVIDWLNGNSGKKETVIELSKKNGGKKEAVLELSKEIGGKKDAILELSKEIGGKKEAAIEPMKDKRENKIAAETKEHKTAFQSKLTVESGANHKNNLAETSANKTKNAVEPNDIEDKEAANAEETATSIHKEKPAGNLFEKTNAINAESNSSFLKNLISQRNDEVPADEIETKKIKGKDWLVSQTDSKAKTENAAPEGKAEEKTKPSSPKESLSAGLLVQDSVPASDKTNRTEDDKDDAAVEKIGTRESVKSHRNSEPLSAVKESENTESPYKIKKDVEIQRETAAAPAQETSAERDAIAYAAPLHQDAAPVKEDLGRPRAVLFTVDAEDASALTGGKSEKVTLAAETSNSEDSFGQAENDSNQTATISLKRDMETDMGSVKIEEAVEILGKGQETEKKEERFFESIKKADPENAAEKPIERKAETSREQIKQHFERVILENWNDSQTAAAPPKSASAPEAPAANNAPPAQSAPSHSTPSANAASSSPEAAAPSMAKEYAEQIAKMQENAAQQIVRAVQGSLGSERSHIRMQLEPESLGRVHIQLKMESGALTAHIMAMKPETRAMLEQNISFLRSAFDDQGIKVERLVVAKEDANGRQENDREEAHSRPRGETSGRNGGAKQQRRGTSSWSGGRYSSQEYFV
ncbi:MAG: flagellar hook-length control protein FliK [Candidatus Omnitrophota bacterium]